MATEPTEPTDLIPTDNDPALTLPAAPSNPMQDPSSTHMIAAAPPIVQQGGTLPPVPLPTPAAPPPSQVVEQPPAGEMPTPLPDVVTVRGANGKPMQVALSAISDPAQREMYRTLAEQQAQEQKAQPPAQGGGAGFTPYQVTPPPTGTGTESPQQLKQQFMRDDKTVLGEEQKAQTAAERAVESQAAVQRKLDHENYETEVERQHRQNDINAKAAASQTAYTQKMQDAADARDKLLSQRQAMTFDPNRWEKSRGIGDRLLGSLSIIAGAMAGSTSIGGTGGNVGLEMMHSAIANDIAAQKEQYARLGDAADAANNVYAAARQMRMDDTQATNMARESMLQDAETALRVHNAKYASPLTDVKKQQALADIAKARADSLKQYTHAAHSEAVQLGTLAGQEAGRKFSQWEGTQRMNLEQSKQSMDVAIANAKPHTRGPGEILHWAGSASSPALQMKAAEWAGAYEATMPLLKRMEQFRVDHSGGTTFDRGAVAKAESMHKGALLQVKTLGELGVLTTGDLDIVYGLIGKSPDSKFVTDDGYAGAIKEAQNYIKSVTMAKMGAFGYTPTEDTDPSKRMVTETETKGGR